MNTKVKAAGLLTAGLASGGILFGTYAANADTTATTSTSQSAPAQAPTGAPTGTPPQGAPTGTPAHGAGSQHGAPGETALTGSDLTKATAAAKSAVPGATIVRAETDSGDSKYEVHVTANGTQKTVKLNADFSLKAVEDGMGK